MKNFCFKKELVVMAMMLYCGVVFSQNTQDVYSAVVPNLDNLTVRTSSNGDAVISGRSYGDNHGNVYSEFIKFDQNVSASRQITINYYGINDFCVLDGYVYFCGGDGNAPYFGYFKESYFNNTTPFYATIFKLPGDFANKITAYIDDATHNVVVTIVGGEYDFIGCPDAFKIAKSHLVVGQINGSTFNYFDYSVIVSNYCYYNFDVPFQDVISTDDYIVATGMETSSSSHSIILSRIKKANLNTREYVSFTDPAYSAVESPVLLESLEGNDVAFSSLYMDMTNTIFYSRVYTCDMNSFTNQSVQDVLLPQKTMPDDLLYLPYDQSLLLLLTAGDFPSHGHLSSIVYYLDPYANVSYTADFMYDENLRWHSLDRMPVSHFVVGGKKISDTRSYVIRDKQAGTVSQCHHFSTTNVTIEPVLTGSPVSETVTESTVLEKEIECTPSDIVLYQGCSD